MAIEDDDAVLRDDLLPDGEEGDAEESSIDDSSTIDDRRSDEPATRSEDDDDDTAYSNRVRKRIDKEVFRRKSAEERENRLKAELDALRADVEAVKSRNAAADAQAAEGTLQGKLTAARQRLSQAIEDGDPQAQAAATEEVADAKAEIREAGRAKQQPEARQPDRPALRTGTAQWLERNQWYMSGQYPRLALRAAELDAALQQEGFSPDHPSMYAELNRRLTKEIPIASAILMDVDEDKAPAPNRKRDAGPPSGASSPDGSVTLKGARRQLVNADLQEMAELNMKDTPENRKIWLATHPTRD
jgi:predicted DNA-binding protein (UPF0251 family)